MTVVDIYCRVSTDPQEDNTSLDEQEANAREFCRENGLTVGKVHREVFSAYVYRERKDLNLMRQRYREGKIQGVVIRTLDRLSRNQTHTAVLLDEMEYYGVTLYCVKEKVDSTPMGKFVVAALALIAEMEREKILDRTLTGRVNKAKEGKIVSGVKARYGWKWIYHTEEGENGKKIAWKEVVLDECEAEVLRKAAQEYADGISLYQTIERLEAEGVPSPNGKKWSIRTLRRLLVDPRMTGKNVKIFTVKNKRAKKHLDPVALPDGTYPPIISEELYQKILERAATNAAVSTRNSRTPERFLLRAGFVRCAYCTYVMTTKTTTNRVGTAYPSYMCPNPHSDCNHYTIPSERLDEAVWQAVSLLADHVALLEQSIELAMQNRSVEDDLRAIEATLADWRAKIVNYEEDLQDSSLRGDTRHGIRNMLNNAYAMVEELERERSELVTFTIDRNRQREEYEKILAWCKKVKSEREELTYIQKRDFLRMLGAVVLVERLEKRNAPVSWDIKVSLPQVEEIIYQGRIDEIGGHTRRYELRAIHQ